MHKNTHKLSDLKPYFLSRLMSAIGDQFLMFAIPLIILKLTGSVKWSSLTFASQWIPRLVFFPIAGQFADFFKVKSIFSIVEAFRIVAVVCGSLFLVLDLPHKYIMLTAMMMIMSLLQAVATVTLESTFPRYIDPEDLPKAQVYVQGIDQFSQIGGAFFASIISSYFDTISVLYTACIFFAFSLAILVFSKIDLNDQKHLHNTFFEIIIMFIKSLGKTYRIGMSEIRNSSFLKYLMLITWSFNLLFSATMVIAPDLVVNYFKLTDKNYGILQGFAATYSFVMLIIAPKISFKFGVDKLGLIAISATICGFIFSVVGYFLQYYLLFFLGVIFILGSASHLNVYIRTLRGLIISKDNFGRVTGTVIMINNSAVPLSALFVSKYSGKFESGSIYTVVGITSCILCLGVFIIGKIGLNLSSTILSVKDINAQAPQQKVHSGHQALNQTQ